MKKYLLPVLLLWVMSIFCQITLEHDYSNGQINYTHLKNSGEKYYLLDRTGLSLKLYNIDHSLYKDVSVPVAFDGYLPLFAYVVSEDLFTLNGEICFVCVYMHATDNTYKARVVSETAGILLEIENANYANAIQTDNDGAKLITWHYSTTGLEMSSKVYSVPGSVHQVTDIGDGWEALPQTVKLDPAYPNPSNGTITINYKLPLSENIGKIIIYDLAGRKVSEYLVDKTFNNLKISTDKLSSGTYLYVLQAGDFKSQPSKFTVVK